MDLMVIAPSTLSCYVAPCTVPLDCKCIELIATIDTIAESVVLQVVRDSSVRRGDVVVSEFVLDALKLTSAGTAYFKPIFLYKDLVIMHQNDGMVVDLLFLSQS